MPENKSLTVRLDFQTYAEFAAATMVKRSRTLSGFVFTFVIETIDEAKQEVGPAKFAELVEKEKKEIERRSTMKKAERKRPNHTFGLAAESEVPIRRIPATKRRAKEKRAG